VFCACVTIDVIYILYLLEAVQPKAALGQLPYHVCVSSHLCEMQSATQCIWQVHRYKRLVHHTCLWIHHCPTALSDFGREQRGMLPQLLTH
jgi:hypothetical protein